MTEGITPNLGATGPDAHVTHGNDHLPAGLTVGEYQVQGLLGEGGFGAVYRAIHPVIGKHAAIKVLKREFSSQPDMVARFIAEARAVNQIRHRNIIDIFSFGVLSDGRQFFVMELLEGSSLEDWIERNGAAPIEVAAPILRSIARALGAAHAAGITHRDIKPENVFLCVDEEGHVLPKLLDFGIAKLVADKQSQFKTRSGVPMGTPLYMSPEQVHGKSVDARSDVYSFGIMAFQILTGRVPFDGESMMDVMMKQLNVQPDAPSSVNPALSPAVDEPLLAMLAKDPAARPESITAALDAVLRAGGVEDAKTSARFEPLSSKRDTGRAVIALGEKDTLIASTAHAIPSPPKRSSLPWIVVGALGLVAGSVGAYLSLREESSANRPVAATPEVVTAPEVGGSPALLTNTAMTTVAPVSTTASAVVVVSAVPSTVTLVVDATPKDAQIFDADKPIGKVGESITVQRGDEEKTLVLKRPGFTPLPISFKPTEDRKLGPLKLVQLAGVKKPSEYGEF